MLKKETKLKNCIRDLKSVIVAFSGGIDSTLVLKIALDELGKENVLAVIGRSETYSQRELSGALKLVKELDVNYTIIATEELYDVNFVKNDDKRCYYCKSDLFNKLTKIAANKKIDFVIDGSNNDDLSNHRPGLMAAKESGIISPLQVAKFSKKDIRELAKKLNLSNWNKPAMACLSSRFAYGQTIDKDSLFKIEKAEELLQDLGLDQVRVRFEKETARIEISPENFNLVVDNNIDIVNNLKSLGFTYVSLDLEGYRSGSANERSKSNAKEICNV